MLMSVSEYANHAGMSRRAFYNWESKQGFPARVDGRIDQVASDDYLSRYRDSHDQRTKNAVKKTATTKAPKVNGSETGRYVEMSIAVIKQRLSDYAGQADSMGDDERAAVAAKAVGLYLSEGPDNPPMTFGGYRLAINESPQHEEGEIIAGGAFGLSALDVVYQCREYVLYVTKDDSDTYPVIPELLYVLAGDIFQSMRI
ncbi:hypothetical protein [Acerihabitans sp.]|uniref:hypothetical protein n=1 Tax=Acerihabitans sp. TaxID=2811394 RepID=UPI002EDADB4A